MKCMLDMGVDVNAQDIDGESILHKACFFGSEAAVKLLLHANANPNVVTLTTSESPLHYAARRGNLSIVLRLVEAGAVPMEGRFGLPEYVARESGFTNLALWLEKVKKMKEAIAIFEQTTPLNDSEQEEVKVRQSKRKRTSTIPFVNSLETFVREHSSDRGASPLQARPLSPRRFSQRPDDGNEDLRAGEFITFTPTQVFKWLNV
jgi:hypothetical protein